MADTFFGRTEPWAPEISDQKIDPTSMDAYSHLGFHSGQEKRGRIFLLIMGAPIEIADLAPHLHVRGNPTQDVMIVYTG